MAVTMKINTNKILQLSTLLLGLFSTTSHAIKGYYRYPALHNDTLIFTAEGDLWKTTLGQRFAQRLTTHPAQESQALISADGKTVAFVANYNGSDEVYVMPIDGGLATQLTFENARVKLHGWDSSGNILYSYNGRVGPTGNWSLRLVDPQSLQVSDVPVADAVDGSIDTTSNTLFFSQFGLQVSNDNAHAYQGGAKGELWSYALGSDKEATHLTAKHQGSVRSPMVYQDKVYFVSNQSGIDNIWSMKRNGRDLTQLTHYRDFGVRDLRLDAGRIVYQLGADLYLYDINTQRSELLELELSSDFSHTREHWLNEPLKYLSSAKLAGNSKKVVITARGRVAVANTAGMRLIEIATPADSRTRQAVMSHDGKSVYALNDASGEIEIWQYPADGSQGAKQLTFDGKTMRWDLYPSPDGKWLAHDDKQGDLWLLNLDTGDNLKILSRNNGLNPIESLSWSGDSKLLAITRNELGAERSQVMLIDINSGQSELLSSDKYASYSPAFSADNKWLYFISERHFNPYPGAPWGDRNMGAAFDRRGQIFAIALDPKSRFPFAPADELQGGDTNDKASKPTEPSADQEADSTSPQDKADSESDNSAKAADVNWQGIAQRLYQVPVPPGNYSQLSVNKGFIYVLDRVTEPGAQTELKSIKIAPKTKVETFLSGVAQYSLSDDGKLLFVRKPGDKHDMSIVPATARYSASGDDIKVQTQDWKLLIDPKQEWQQIFHDAWLMHRDSLFDPKMRGLDWAAIQQKYQPLLARLTERSELNDIFEQMMGELNTLHSQVRGGDLPSATNTPQIATLGAQYQPSEQGLLIKRIFANDPEILSRLAPLARPGVDAQEGDIITAVNNIAVASQADLHKALLNQAGKQVLLTLQRQGQEVKTVVVAASNRDEMMYRYYDWVTNNQQKVEAADQDIGYFHLRAMVASDIETFAREFYAQYNKQGLIIDVRRNNGGNVDSWIIEKLLRRVWSFWRPTNGEQFTNMQQTFRGHLVVLADQFTYSDGETFTAAIKALKLAPVVGKQTAGAGVWLTGRNSQTDGGMARVAEFPVFAVDDGHWITEGQGIKPDVEIDNLPYATFMGQDAQLEEAIKILKKQIKKAPVKPLKAKPLPKDTGPAADIVN